MKLSENAIQRLRDVQAVIRAEPRRLEMGTWLATAEAPYDYMRGDYPPCGTVGCVAGWLVILNGANRPTRELANELLIRNGMPINVQAAKLISPGEYCHETKFRELFLMENSPTGFIKLEGAEDAEERAELVCGHIDWWISKYSK